MEENKDLEMEIYKDVLQPSARELSRALIPVAKCISLLSFPFEAFHLIANERKVQLLKRIQIKAQSIPVEDIQIPPIRLTTSAVKGYLDCIEEQQLQSFFEDLIVSGINKSKNDILHPSFASILPQISHEEAKIIEYIAAKYGCANGISLKEVTSSSDDVEHYIHRAFLKLCSDSGIKEGVECLPFFYNLKRLGIMDIELGSDHSNLRNDFGESQVRFNYYGSLILTSYGSNFINCVVGV